MKSTIYDPLHTIEQIIYEPSKPYKKAVYALVIVRKTLYANFYGELFFIQVVNALGFLMVLMNYIYGPIHCEQNTIYVAIIGVIGSIYCPFYVN